jgi:hypothetical protein
MHLIDSGFPQCKPAGEVVGTQRMPFIQLPMNLQGVAAVEAGAKQDGFPEVAHHGKMRLESSLP